MSLHLRVAQRFLAAGNKTFYHVTTSEAAASIMKHGFRAEQPRRGWDMGRGVYLTPHLSVIDQKWMSHLTDRVTIEVSAPSKLLKIENDWPLEVYRALLGYEAGNEAFDEARRQRLLQNKSPVEVWNAVLQPLVKKAGYKGCVDLSRQDNTVIFDPADAKPVRILT
jgi:hypothetical protein